MPHDATNSENGPTQSGVRATVLGPAKNSMFRLRTVDGREVLAHAAGSLRMAFVRLLPGDQVLAELSAFDPDKARICRILKSSQPSQHRSPPDHP
jgi:translation initiation factor IF-1